MYKGKTRNRNISTFLLFAIAMLIGQIIWMGIGFEKEETRLKENYNEVSTLSHKYKAERDNALELAEQYKKQYQEAVFEIAFLKAQNEELANQVDILREPSENAYKDIGWDFDYVVRVVGAEARGEPWEGILAVCQCIADTADRTGKTPYEVVQTGYAKPLSHSVTDNMETVNEACLLVFVNGYRPYPEPIEYFYAYENVYSSWHESQTFCYQIGGHRYFKGVTQ